MKKLFVLLMAITVLVSCKEDQNKDAETTSEKKTMVAEEGKTLKQSDGFIAIHGKFLFDDAKSAAVLMTPTQVYGVVVNEQARTLSEEVAKFKSEPYDMVPVTIRGRIIKNEGATTEWENKIEIKEILKVSEPKQEENDVIKLGS